MTERTEARGSQEPRLGSRRLAALLGLARAALLWERVWRALWPATGVAGLFLAVVLLDLLPLLPGWLHALGLLAFLAAFAVLATRGARSLRLPSAEGAGRRLELDSELDHRPLAALHDRLAGGAANRDAVELWNLHRRRMRARLAGLRVHWPRPGLVAADPRALRVVVGLLLVLGLAAGHGDWRARVHRAMTPELAALAAAPAASLDVWIDPPAYTGVAPLFLDPDHAGPEVLSLPVGSTVLAQVRGGRGVPSLILGDETTPFTAVAAGAYEISAEIAAGDRIRIDQGGGMLAEWRLDLTPDLEPSVVFLSAPGRSERGALRIQYRAEDDYGLARVGAVVRRIDEPEATPIGLDLPLSGIGLRSVDGLGFHDLTPHPWAGLAVEIKLVAEDAAEQTGESDWVRTVLPERVFNHPLARALVELRKQLTLNPKARLPVVRALSGMYDRPEHYAHDVVVALALRSAERRLIHDATPGAVAEVQQLLWDTALHLEEGGLAIAERELREIQKALMDALARGAEDDEIEDLIDQLEQAMDRFLEALAEQLRKQLAQGGELEPLDPDAQVLETRELQRMIERARELARTGARDAARDLLSRLQEMLEGLRANPFAQRMDERTRRAFEAMRKMDSMMQRQQDLLNRSFQRSRRTPPEGEEEQSQQENQRDTRDQESLRRDLGALMRRLADALGDLPRPLGRAEREMRDASRALGQDRAGEAVGPQTRALDQMQQGMEAMIQQFTQQLGAGGPRGQGRLGAQFGSSTDPFGRQPGNMGMEALEGVRIPEESELRRSREILDELRRRSGERRRPAFELDYIDRLLKQF